MDVIHNVIWRIAFLVECAINYCLQLCFLALTDSRSGVLICIIARTNRRQSGSQTLKRMKMRNFGTVFPNRTRNAEKSY